MKKDAALRYIKYMGNKGFLTHSMIIDKIYSQEDDIPKQVVKLCVTIPEERVFTMYVNRTMYDAINSAITEELNRKIK